MQTRHVLAAAFSASSYPETGSSSLEHLSDIKYILKNHVPRHHGFIVFDNQKIPPFLSMSVCLLFFKFQHNSLNVWKIAKSF
jgi:hypothetical protein